MTYSLLSRKTTTVACPQGDLSLFTHHLRDALGGKAAVRGDGLIHVLDVFHYVNEAVQADEHKQTPILKVKDLDLNFAIAVAPAQTSKVLKTLEVSRESSKDESVIRAKIKAIDKTLADLRAELERGFIDFGRYSRLKADWERQKAELEAQLRKAVG